MLAVEMKTPAGKTLLLNLEMVFLFLEGEKGEAVAMSVGGNGAPVGMTFEEVAAEMLADGEGPAFMLMQDSATSRRCVLNLEQVFAFQENDEGKMEAVALTGQAAPTGMTAAELKTKMASV